MLSELSRHFTKQLFLLCFIWKKNEIIPKLLRADINFPNNHPSPRTQPRCKFITNYILWILICLNGRVQTRDQYTGHLLQYIVLQYLLVIYIVHCTIYMVICPVYQSVEDCSVELAPDQYVQWGGKGGEVGVRGEV